MRYFENYQESEETLYRIQMLMAYDKVDDVKAFENHFEDYDESLKECLPDFMKKTCLDIF